MSVRRESVCIVVHSYEAHYCIRWPAESTHKMFRVSVADGISVPALMLYNLDIKQQTPDIRLLTDQKGCRDAFCCEGKITRSLVKDALKV